MLLSDVKIISRGEIEEEDDHPGFSYTEIGFEIFERNSNLIDLYLQMLEQMLSQPTGAATRRMRRGGALQYTED